MHTHCTDVVIHIDEDLQDDDIQAIERDIALHSGVYSDCVNDRARHLMLVDYDPEGIAALGCDYWPLAAFRELDDALCHLRFNEETVGLVLLRTEGDAEAVAKLDETLDVYPQVKGLQIMNDNGNYMFSQYAGKWIPDTPGRREAIKNTMRLWRPFSDSNPVDGIQAVEIEIFEHHQHLRQQHPTGRRQGRAVGGLHR